MSTYRKILVAVDGAPPSMHALRQSFKLAAREKSWITVTSVAPPYEGDLALTGVGDVMAILRNPCERALSEATRLADADGALIKTVCQQGEPHERIIDLAEAENCDLVVTGRTGKAGVRKAFVGSVAARVIGYSAIDVMVVPEDGQIEWDVILHATDGSAFSLKAGERAIDLARSHGSRLCLVNVISVPPEFYAEASQKIIDEMVSRAETAIRTVKKKAEASGVSVQGFVREDSDPDGQIMAVAREVNAKLIVLGSHGRTGLTRLLMGSVAERVIGHSDIPVLVAR